MKRNVAIGVTLAVCMASFAQPSGSDQPAELGGSEFRDWPRSHIGTLADSLAGVLPGAFAANSQNFLDDALSGYNNSGADDVAVPACETWSVTLLEVAGSYSDPLSIGTAGPAVSVSVYVFLDSSGEPDTADYSGALYGFEGLNYTDVGSGDLSIPLPSPIQLPGGVSGSTYWIAVRVDLSVLVGGQWGWAETNIDLGANVSHWQQSAAGVLVGINDCVMDWKSRATCGLVGTNDQLAIRLEGWSATTCPPFPVCNASHGVDFTLSDHTFLDPELFEVCDTITVGPNLQVAGPGGDLTLRAGSRVVLDEGASVGIDGRLTIEIDPALVP
jgi:hypothetical protein